MEYEKRIDELKAQLHALDALLDSQRTPRMKARLRYAGNVLDDVVQYLRHAAEEDLTPRAVAMWHDAAEQDLQIATQILKSIHELVEKYGGPAKVNEVGGN